MHMGDVWDFDRVPISDDCFNAIVRTEAQGYRLYGQMTQSESSSLINTNTNTVQPMPIQNDMFNACIDEKDDAHL